MADAILPSEAVGADNRAWELCKENAQPVKRGRKAAALSARLEEGVAPAASEAEQREAWEAKLAAEAAGGDPIAPWCDYIKWQQDANVTGGGPNPLLPLLERCAHAFKDDQRYADDARYLRVWIMYADLVRDAEPLFDYLYGRQIGQMQTLFWESWAAVLEAKRKMDAADQAFTRGELIRAQPLQRLQRAHQQFQHRLVKRIMTAPPEAASNVSSSAEPGGARAPKERKALNRLKKSEAKPGVNRPTTQRAEKPLGRAPPNPSSSAASGGGGALSSLGNFQIFEDVDSAEAEEGPSAWETGTATENIKENTARATAWTEARIPDSKARARPAAAVPAAPAAPFSIAVDEDLAEALEQGPPAGGASDEAAARAPMRLQLAGPSLRDGSHAAAHADLANNPLARFVSPEAPPPRRAAPTSSENVASNAGGGAAPALAPAANSAPAAEQAAEQAVGFERSLLVGPDGDECCFEEARARARHGYGLKAAGPAPPPVEGDYVSSGEEDEEEDGQAAAAAAAAPAKFDIFCDEGAEDAAPTPAAAATPGFAIFCDDGAAAADEPEPLIAFTPAPAPGGGFTIFDESTAAPDENAPAAADVAAAIRGRAAERAAEAQHQAEAADATDDGLTINTKAALADLMPCFSDEVSADGGSAAPEPAALARLPTATPGPVPSAARRPFGATAGPVAVCEDTPLRGPKPRAGADTLCAETPTARRGALGTLGAAPGTAAAPLTARPVRTPALAPHPAATPGLAARFAATPGSVLKGVLGLAATHSTVPRSNSKAIYSRRPPTPDSQEKVSPEYTINTKAAMADLLPCFEGGVEEGDEGEESPALAPAPAPAKFDIFCDEGAEDGAPPASAGFTIFDEKAAASE